jgi:hypothetical protein
VGVVAAAAAVAAFTATFATTIVAATTVVNLFKVAVGIAFSKTPHIRVTPHVKVICVGHCTNGGYKITAPDKGCMIVKN